MKHELETEMKWKSQIDEWRCLDSPRPKKKFRRAQSKVKPIAYDHQGIIMINRVPCRTSVTAMYYPNITRPHIGNIATEKLRRYGYSLQSGHESTRLHIMPKIERT